MIYKKKKNVKYIKPNLEQVMKLISLQNQIRKLSSNKTLLISRSQKCPNQQKEKRKFKPRNKIN